MKSKKPQVEPENMKVIAETTGDFMLINSVSGEEIAPDRPSVVRFTSFIDSQLAKRNVKILARGLPNKASDADFLEVLTALKGDKEAAALAYAAEFGLDTLGNPIEVEETAEQKKAREKAEKDAEKEAKKKAKEEAEKAEAEEKAKAEEEARLKAEEEAAAENPDQKDE